MLFRSAEILLFALPGADGITFIKQAEEFGLLKKITVAFLGFSETYLGAFGELEHFRRDAGVGEAALATQASFINVLAHLRNACGGDLDRVRRVVRLGGFVACAPDFYDHALVMNGASDLAVAVFGVHIASLPGFIGLALCFGMLTASLGLLIAAFGKTPEAARRIAMFAVLIMVMLGGAWMPSFLFDFQASLVEWAIRKGRAVVPFPDFYFLYNRINGLDEAYRPHGFAEIQALLPKGGELEVCRDLLAILGEQRLAPIFTTMKGHVGDDCLLGFPGDGMSVTFGLRKPPVAGRSRFRDSLGRLFDRVFAAGGRVNPSKDEFLTADRFQRMFAGVPRFLELKRREIGRAHV